MLGSDDSIFVTVYAVVDTVLVPSVVFAYKYPFSVNFKSIDKLVTNVQFVLS